MHIQFIERFILTSITVTIAMATTIQIQETTKQVLDSVKNQEHLASYDETINHLLHTHLDIPDMFGYTKTRPLRWSKKDEMDSHEL